MAEKPSPTTLKLSIAGLSLLVALSGYGVFLAFKIGGFSKITVHGWTALSIAVVATAVLTGGLIWLAFYSATHGYDDR